MSLDNMIAFYLASLGQALTTIAGLLTEQEEGSRAERLLLTMFRWMMRDYDEILEGDVKLVVQCSFATPEYWTSLIDAHLGSSSNEVVYRVSRAQVWMGVSPGTNAETAPQLGTFSFLGPEHMRSSFTSEVAITLDYVPTGGYLAKALPRGKTGQQPFACLTFDAQSSSSPPVIRNFPATSESHSGIPAAQAGPLKVEPEGVMITYNETANEHCTTNLTSPSRISS